jgi:hypothetical protein
MFNTSRRETMAYVCRSQLVLGRYVLKFTKVRNYGWLDQAYIEMYIFTTSVMGNILRLPPYKGEIQNIKTNDFKS